MKNDLFGFLISQKLNKTIFLRYLVDRQDLVSLLWYVNYNIISLCMHELRHNRSCSNFRIYFTTMQQPQNFPLCIKSQFIRASGTDSSFFSIFLFLVLKSSLSMQHQKQTETNLLEELSETNFQNSPIFYERIKIAQTRYATYITTSKCFMTFSMSILLRS